MRRLVDLVGLVCLVLLLSAFDERGAEQTVHQARAGLTSAWEKVAGATATDAPLPGQASDHGLRADFEATGKESPWSGLAANGADLVIEGLGTIKTRPHRIARGDEPSLQRLKAAPGQQVEVREVVSIAFIHEGQPLCGDTPVQYLALVVEGRQLRMLAFDAVPEGAVQPCAGLEFRLA